MVCPNCGKEVKEGAKFCVGCGMALNNDTNKEISPTEENKQGVEFKEKVSSTVLEMKANAKKAADSDFMKFVISTLVFLFNCLMKPIKTLKEKIDDYSKVDKACVLAGVVALGTMIVRVVVEFLMALIRKQCVFTTCATIGEKLKAIDWMGITLKHLIIILMVMFAIAAIYYVASLIAKKNANYMRLLTITVVSFVPACLTMYLLTPIFGWINVHLGVIVTVVGMIYALVIFFTAINDEFKFDSADKSVYFNLICISIIVIILYFIGYNMAANAIGSISSMGF